MQQQGPTVEKADLNRFCEYIANFWLFLQINEQTMAAQLSSQKNKQNLITFAMNYQIRFIILQRNKNNGINVQLEWIQEMLSTCNILLIKKNNFNLYHQITAFKISQMIQIVTLDLQNQQDPLNISYQYTNKLMMPLIALYRNQFQKKSTSDKNAFANVVKKLNQLNFSFAQCQQAITIPQIKIQTHQKVKKIVQKKQTQLYLNNTDLITQQQANTFGQDVMKWNREIQLLLKTQFQLINSTSLQQKIFWNSYLNSLKDLQLQVLKSQQVKFYIAILKKKNKFHLTASFDAGFASIVKKIQNVSQINNLFKTIPIQQIMAAQTIQQLISNLSILIQNLKGIINIEYETKRVYQLIQVICKDCTNQLLKILGKQNLMFCNYKQFIIIYTKCSQVFLKLDENINNFMSRTRNNYIGVITTAQIYSKTNYQHIPLKLRLQQLNKIRDIYQNLKNVIQDIISKSTNKQFLSTIDIQSGYNSFKGINVLNLNKQGEEILNRTEKQFNHYIQTAQTYITKKLREKLGGATNAKQMFRVFSKFSGLFFRPKIKSAIQEYQTQLLKTVKDGITLLQSKYFATFEKTNNIKICRIRDIPYNPGKQMWAKQIRAKLSKYNKKIQQILLDNCKQNPQGKQIMSKIDLLIKNLNIEKWKKDWIERINSIVKGTQYNKKTLFTLVKKNKYQVSVNFSEQQLQYMKQVRIFQLAQPKNSYVLVGKSFVQMYPSILSLQQSIYSYLQVNEKMDERLIKLLAKKKNYVMKIIESGFTLNLSDNNIKVIQKYSKSLAQSVLQLSQMQNFVNQNYIIISSTIQQLQTCQLQSQILSTKLIKIQDIINNFNIRNVSNLHIWVPQLNQQIQTVFSKRLQQLIQRWIYQFVNFKQIDQQQQYDKLLHQDMRHQIKSENNVFYLDPPLQHAKFSWLQQFHRIIGIICKLPRIQANPYSHLKKKQQQNYENILSTISAQILSQAYNDIFNIFKQAEQYIKIWINYQSLWVIDPQKIYSKLGDDITLWQNILNQIRENRKTFDNSKTQRYFGPIIIDYRLVLNRINTKYDSWHNEIIGHFGNKFLQKLKLFYSNCQISRTKLQKINFQNLSTDLVDMINDFQSVKKKQMQWAKQVLKFDSSNKLLQRQRYKYPSDWLDIQKVMQQWMSFQQIFKKKLQQLQNQIPKLQDKILFDQKNLNNKIKQIQFQWNKQKPSNGQLNPQQALNILNTLNNKINNIRNVYDKCCKAKQLLNLPSGNPQKIDNLKDDIEQLQQIWTHLKAIWAPYEAIKDTYITAKSKKQIKQISIEAINLLNATPMKLKSNEPFQAMKQKISLPNGAYYLMNKKIIQLKQQHMKSRHWKTFINKLKINVPQNEITFNILWNIDLNKNQQIFRQIIAIATGQNVLQRMLQGVKQKWIPKQLQLVRYQSKCNLIKGWDDMFQQLDQDLNNLSSMKLSQYYRTFQQQIIQWDQKLQKMRIILDIWIDVQRRWVYLQSIFLGSSDIKDMLVNQYQRFRNIDGQFTSLMKKVTAKPNLIQTINIQSLQKTLQRLSQMLANIQKALGDYLQTQRAAFARFYFIGDEDLLQIIGNSKDVAIVQRHFTKMYAGITALKNTKTQNQDIIHTMLSRQGQIVQFKKGINITQDPKINIWLTKVDNQMRLTLATFLQNVMGQILQIQQKNINIGQQLIKIIQKNPAQIVLLGLQTLWSKKVQNALIQGRSQYLQNVQKYIINFLTLLATNVVADLKKDLRQKFQQAITDFVHQRDVIRKLIKNKINSNKVFAWLYFMRMIYYPKQQDTLKKLLIQMANANFHYGFQYLGVGEKLVQTPLTDRCFLTLTQALHLRMGGAPFGPAGTGKTQSVKALGAQLGRFVLVFNCDQTFDFHAMGRIFIGLCQVGAWGCFDQFNRLQERMLSACSQQILVIQTGLRERQNKIQLMGKQVKLNPQVGCFVTMNPGYAGRSNLPQNLKQLFRQMAMVKPDGQLIAQVMLYSQGYKTAQQLAGKIVSLFDLCKDQLSSQPHYDFGLRALKSVLVSAGNMKRQQIMQLKKQNKDANTYTNQVLQQFQQRILLRSVCETIVPKLIANDIPLLSNLLQGVFPGSSIPSIQQPQLRQNLKKICKQILIQSQNSFIQKVLQLFQIQRLHHGLMMVGPSGSGKTKAWQTLLYAMEKTDKIKGQSYVIDPKAINKDQLYGKLDSTTLQWTDGVFTGVLRKITQNQRGQSSKRHWIIFDGDVDPQWAQNLNSVLDDNKLLTLPNGQRIQIPPNVRIMFQVQTLKYATLATVSRCGMVWFSEQVIKPKMIFSHYLQRLKQQDYDKLPKINLQNESTQQKKQKIFNLSTFTRQKCVQSIEKLFIDDATTLGENSLLIVEKMQHVMEFTIIRVIQASMALIRKGISNVLQYNQSHPQLTLSDQILAKYMKKWTIQSIMWGFGGSMTLKQRQKFSKKLADVIPVHEVQLPSLLHQTQGSASVPYIFIDFQVRIQDGEWHLWKKKVPTIEIDSQRVTDADVIIPTIDTIRHQQVLCSWLSQHRPFLLCGPPGSGKTMTLMSTLKVLPDFQMIFVNFSSSTTPALIMKQFQHYCQYVKTVSGIILRPKQPSKWLVVFCDQINLPDVDKYGTMTVITFLRQLTEQHGFWRTTDKQWISLERIQFVGACNPPTDIGRKPLNPRFLRHCPLILVDFPGFQSLKQIFGTFNKAMLKRSLGLKTLADYLTNSMVQFYTESQKHFTADIQPHYIYSPRQLTRWKYAINEVIQNVNSVEDLVRLWAHQALRLFQDRLVLPQQKQWCQSLIDEVANRNFPSLQSTCLQKPILFSSYLTKSYVSVDPTQLKNYVESRLKIFYEQQLNVPIVVFDEVLQHILRIDRVLRQPLGHLLLVGASGVGKTTLSRFVSWLNNITVFQIKAGKNYSLQDFDQDLRNVMKRSGVKLQKICFIFDQSNCLSPAFLQKMNALLASGQIPGLFQGQQYMLLLSQYKQNNTKNVTSDDQIYKTFIKNVQRNLHVVFTMNPNNPDFSNRTASSPALFNRCVIDWFGDWSQQGLIQVAKHFTSVINPVKQSFQSPLQTQQQKHNVVINTIVSIHNTVIELNKKLAKSAKKYNYITPRDFLDFIKHFIVLYDQKKQMLEGQQFHLNTGLNKLKQTQMQVIQMQGSLDAKKNQLQAKQKQANSKMTMIVHQKSKTKQKQIQSSNLKVKLQEKQVQIRAKKSVVQKDLQRALPALQAAQKNVENINRKDLQTIRNYGSPPANVVLAMKPVYIMITKTIPTKNKPLQWPTIRQFMQKDFIKQVIQLKADDLPQKVKAYVLSQYLNTPQFDIEAIIKASQAAGALASWAKSQLSYADILTKVNPMKNQILQLQQQGKKLKLNAQQLANTINDLQKKTKQLQQQYQNLIKDKQQILNDMNKVQDKVARSKKLLMNLSSEKYRWEDTSKNFKSQLASMLGDVFLSSAFLAYIGFFDHYYRKLLIGVWKTNLQSSKIKYRRELSIIQYLSSPGQRLIWKSNKLPSDDLCTENAIIMKRYHKYPLIIDPSGQAMQYLLSLLSKKQYILSSFADDAFLKNLQKSIRFGKPLIVQDVQKVQPILNSVLNKQIYKTGGMTLIRVGDQQIDFNNNFSMFMITRNNNAKFTPDLCSRVTFVNFTITSSSLQDQCLNIYLRNQRPDVEEKRLNLMKIQGQYIVKLRQLQDLLLDALSHVQGSILQSQSVITTLQKLKNQASKITQQMKKSNQIMSQVNTVTQGYKFIAQASSKIFFALQSMSTLHYLYQYSLNFFLDTIFRLLDNDQKLSKINKNQYELRKQSIYKLLFQKIFIRVSNSLLSKDLIIFSLKLVQIKLSKQSNQLFNLLIKPTMLINTKLSKNMLKGLLNQDQLKYIQKLQQQPLFSNLVNHIQNNQDKWVKFMIASNPQQVFPDLAIQAQQIDKKIFNLILIKIFRPDKFNPVAYDLIKRVLGDQCKQGNTLDFKQVVISCKAKQPILLSSAPGFDPSYKVQQLSKEVHSKLFPVAIGSSEGFQIAQRSIKDAVKQGAWVMLKNVHLDPVWLSQLQKKIHVLTPHQNFRLFLTAQFSPKIPSTLIRQSYKLVFEPADGIKASLLRTYKTVLSSARSDRLPAQRCRLHFLLGWLHAVILQRLRYTPIGWTKIYQFNQADQRCALDLIDQYIDSFGSRSNIDIDKIPWDAFRTILIQNLYGGKVDNQYDNKILVSLVEMFFTPQSFQSTYPLYRSQDPTDTPFTMPDGLKYSQFLAWVQKLPNIQSPAWSGLPNNVEKILKAQQTKRSTSELYKLLDINEQQITLEKKKQQKKNNQQLKWLSQVNNKVSKFIAIIPKQIKKLQRTQNKMNNPLFRFLQREVIVVTKMLNNIQKNLIDIGQMCNGKILATNLLRQLAKDIHADVITKSWVHFIIDPNITLTNYIIDLQRRFEQFNKLIDVADYQNVGVWFGGLLFPQAYMTATRQFVAQRNGWSLQQLQIKVQKLKQQKINQQSFLITGLRIQGGNWTQNNQIIPIKDNQQIGSSLPQMLMTWQKVGNKVLSSDQMMIPVYLNRTRKNLIMSIRVKCGDYRTLLYQKGIAIIAWTM